MSIKDWFKSKEEREIAKRKATDAVRLYLETAKTRFQNDFRDNAVAVKNVIWGALEHLEDGENPKKVLRKMSNYLSQANLRIDSPSFYTISNPYVKTRSTPEEIVQKNNLRIRKDRREKANKLYAEWSKESKPILAKVLSENPSVLTDMEYSISSGFPPAGGSFYNPDTLERKVRKDGEKYFIDTFAMGTPYKKDEEGYTLKEVSDLVSAELLDEASGIHGYFKGKKIIEKTGRTYLARHIKNKFGLDLKSEVQKSKRNGLEGRLSIFISLTGFLGAIFFFSSNITGFSISDLSQNLTKSFGILLFLVGLIGAFIFLKNR